MKIKKMEKASECKFEQMLISKNPHVALENQMTELKRFAKEDNQNYSIPKIINQKIPSENIRKLQIQNRLQRGGKKHSVNVCCGKTVQTTTSKVVILGDSHLKGSVLRTGNYLSAKFEVSGFIKAGASFEKKSGKDNNGLIQTNKKWCASAQWWC